MKCSSPSEVAISCSNDTAQDGLAAEQRQRLKAGFAQMWPANSPFPPAMPWLAAVVGRGEAWAWVVSLARQDGSIRLDSPVQALDFVGRAMNAGGAYGTVRKKEKKRTNTRPNGRSTHYCFTGCYEDGRWTEAYSYCTDRERCCTGCGPSGAYAYCTTGACDDGDRDFGGAGDVSSETQTRWG